MKCCRGKSRACDEREQRKANLLLLHDISMSCSWRFSATRHKSFPICVDSRRIHIFPLFVVDFLCQFFFSFQFQELQQCLIRFAVCGGGREWKP